MARWSLSAGAEQRARHVGCGGAHPELDRQSRASGSSHLVLVSWRRSDYAVVVCTASNKST